MAALNMKAIVTFVSPAILAVLLFASASAVNAASFDCKKAQSKTEQMICSDPKLSALDEELSAVYKEASGLVSDPSAMKKAQLEWINQKRSASDNPGDLEAAYLARIEEIRLDPRVKRSSMPGPRLPRPFSADTAKQSRTVPILRRERMNMTILENRWRVL